MLPLYLPNLPPLYLPFLEQPRYFCTKFMAFFCTKFWRFWPSCRTTWSGQKKKNMSEIWKTWPGPEENLKRLSPMGNPILFSDKNARQSGSCHLKDTTFLMISIHQHQNKWWLGNHFRNWFMMVSDDQTFRPVTTMGILRSMNFQDQMVKPPTSDGFRLSDYPWISMIPWSNGETLRGIPPSTARRVHWPLSVWGSKRRLRCADDGYDVGDRFPRMRLVSKTQPPFKDNKIEEVQFTTIYISCILSVFFKNLFF